MLRSLVPLVALSLASVAVAAPPAAAPALPVVHVVSVGDVDSDRPLGPDLARALDPVSAIDNAPEEKERGITINTSHVEYETAKRHVVFADPADETELVKGVVLGVDRLDGAVVVVDAEAGVTDGVEEGVRLADALGATDAVVWLERSGLVKDDALAALEKELRALLARAGFDGDHTPIIRGSALGSEARDTKALLGLVQAVEAGIETPPRDKDKPFRMAVEGAQVVAGQPVARGTVETGDVAAGDVVEIVGMGLPAARAKVADLGMSRVSDVAGPGDAVGVVLGATQGLGLVPGRVLAAPGTVASHVVVKAEVYVLKKEEGGRHTPFHNKYRPQFRLNGTDVTGEIVLAEGRGAIDLGDHGEVTVSLIVPVAMDKGLRFAIREGGRTVGAGQVTEIVK